MENKFILNDKLYKKSIIKKVIKDFSEVSKIWYDEDVLKIEWENSEEIKEVFNEFMNYYIALLNEG